MNGVYFEDVVIGYREESPAITVDGDEMVRYAEQNDPHAIHLDEAFARTTPFGGVVASFGYTVSLLLRLVHRLRFVQETTPAFLGALEWRLQFHGPVRGGDRLHVVLEVVQKKMASRGDRGVVTSRYELINQTGATAIAVDVVWLLANRNGGQGVTATPEVQ